VGKPLPEWRNCCENERQQLLERTEPNMSIHELPAKRFAEQELPNEKAGRSAGIGLGLEQARLVLMLWSRVIAHGEAKRRNIPYGAATAIERVVSTTVPVGVGDLLGPLVSGEATCVVPTGGTAMRRLGIDSAAISSLWGDSPTFATSCLPLSWVLAFLPAPAWGYVAALIECRSGEVLPRVHEALKQHGKQAGSPSLKADLDNIWVVFEQLVTLRTELRAADEARASTSATRLFRSHALEAWTAVPPRPKQREVESMGRGGRGRRDVSAVPLEAVRHALKYHARKANWGKWRPESWPYNCCWTALKRLLTLCLLLSVCPRVDHLRLLDVDDFDPAHTFEDGSVGPGLRFRRRMMKGGGRSNDAYWKRLPDVVAAILTAWIICSGRKVGQANAPLIISKRTTAAGEEGKRYSGNDSMSVFVGGPKSRPLIPLPGQARKGYTAHRFRRTVMQTIERLYLAWKLANPSHPLAAYDGKVFGELAIDHHVEDMGYRDFTDRKRLEEIQALAIELNWAEFWGDGLQRRGLDPEAIINAREHVVLLEAELQRIEHELTELEVQEVEVLRLAGTARAEREQLHALLRSQAIGGEIRQKLRRELKMKDELIAAKAKLEEARTTKVVLPEDIDGEYERKLAEALAETEGGERSERQLVPATRMADELTVADLAELFGVAEMTIRRWRAGQSNPPLDPETWLKVNAKDWRYPVAAIDARALSRIPADDPQATVDAIRRKRAALGFAKRKSGTNAVAAAA
jgi:transcriptional regulator with XRE-family HTH domain